tara:strand:- start:4728 stop:5177 length:450 start_codon:yes stop_codon:yes gene_type:complete
MILSENFSLEELTKSQTALRKGIDNTPNADHIASLGNLAMNILQPVRNHFGKPYTPSSGYRSVELCLAIGSSEKSQHAKGEAADFEVPNVSNMELAQWIVSNLDFDQLILEYYTGGNTGWVHCSYKESGNRKEILTLSKAHGYKIGLHN